VLRTLLVLAVAILAGGVLLAASGGIGPALGALAGGFNTALNKLVATPVPTSTDLPPTDSPRIAPPEQPYTNTAAIALNVSVPSAVVGDPTAKVRIYLALAGLEAAPVIDVPIGTTSRMVVPFELTEGRNDISATLFRGDQESEHSLIVTWILDVDPPKIAIASPQDGASVDTPVVTIKGTTQAGTTLVARNAANNVSITTIAARDGTFELSLPLVPGEQEIAISATDPAGNQAEKTITLKQGSTQMRVQLRASAYQISVAHHPSSLQLTVLVTDPSGKPLVGASAFFTLQIPGLAPISNQLYTGLDGRAVFTTPLVGTLSKGSGVATVLVTHDVYGESTDRVALIFVK
jgi:large repetitive protein